MPIVQLIQYLQEKFGFSDEDMQSVPQDPFKYLREIFKNTAFRAYQYKMLHKLIYTKKLLHICRLVDTNLCERCINYLTIFSPSTSVKDLRSTNTWFLPSGTFRKDPRKENTLKHTF